MNLFPTKVRRLSAVSAAMLNLRLLSTIAVGILVILGVWSLNRENNKINIDWPGQDSRDRVKKGAQKIGNNVSYDPFTGLSVGGVSGSSGKRFLDSQCRTWTGHNFSLDPPGSGNTGDGGKLCDQWVVITTINPPTKTINNIDAIDGWCQVVVFDKKTPFQEYKGLNNTILLSVEDQIKFMNQYNLASIQLMPWNHFGRKNVGFLYAIAHGAKVIYDTDDDNVPLDGLDPNTELVELETSETTFNVYNHFANKKGKIWPRGFPLEDINQEEKKSKCCKTIEDGVFVRQHLAQHDPDVDAIYRLTSKLPYYFNTEDKGLVLPEGTFVPYNAQATFHKYQAFFGLLLPITVHGRVSDIWRSYFTQKLLWLAGGSLAFLPPLVVQNRNVHDYLADLDSEVPLYMKAGQLVSFLDSWKVDSSVGLEESMWSLAVGMYSHCYWEEEDVHLVKAWIQDLTNIGYIFPESASRTTNKCVRAKCKQSTQKMQTENE